MLNTTYDTIPKNLGYINEFKTEYWAKKLSNIKEFKIGIFCLQNSSNPKFANPIEFSIPEGVSQILGGAFPSLGLIELLHLAPSPPFPDILLK